QRILDAARFATISERQIIMTVFLYFGDHRRRDIDNYSKVINDCLEGNAYKDDCQIVEMHLFKAIDIGSPRVEIYLREQ
ncbi:hypothetical protein LCGC14_2813560, partial [marine sediment metagenome]